MGEGVIAEFDKNAIYTLVAIDNSGCTFILSSIVVIKPDITAGHNILLISKSDFVDTQQKLPLERSQLYGTK